METSMSIAAACAARLRRQKDPVHKTSEENISNQREGCARTARVLIGSASEGTEEYDVFKHSLLRYLGYANELGSSSPSCFSAPLRLRA